MTKTYNPPPNWPVPPEGWTPPKGWKPDPAWGPAPAGWQLWLDNGYGNPAPKSNWFSRHKVFTGIGAFLLIGMAACTAGGGDDQEAASDTSDVVVTEEPAEVLAETTEAVPASTEPEPEPTEAPEEVAAAESTPPVEPAPAVDPYASYPAPEVAFIDTIIAARENQNSDATELQRSAAQTERDASLCAVSNNGTLEGWVGEVVEIGANNDGLAHVKIEIADGIVLQTWNNAFSDVMDGTLIPPGTPAFDNLLAMEEGTKVNFSGQTVGSDTACIKGANITDTFYMIDPNFIVRIADIRAL